MTGDDITLAEVTRRVRVLEGMFPERIITRREYEADKSTIKGSWDALEWRVERLEGSITWLSRAVTTAIFGLVAQAILLVLLARGGL